MVVRWIIGEAIRRLWCIATVVCNPFIALAIPKWFHGFIFGHSRWTSIHGKRGIAYLSGTSDPILSVIGLSLFWFCFNDDWPIDFRDNLPHDAQSFFSKIKRTFRQKIGHINDEKTNSNR